MRCLAKTKTKRKYKQCTKSTKFIFCSEHWKKHYKKIVGILLIIGGIFTIFEKLETIKGWFKKDHEKFVEANYIQAIVAPFNVQKETIINFGSGQFTFQIPENGLNLSDQNIFAGCTKKNDEGETLIDNGYNFTISIKNGVFLISIIIRDLKTGNIITEIQNNQILIDKLGRVNNYHSDSHSLEIRDQYGYIAFRMWVNEKDQLEMEGYFYGKYCTIFINGDFMEILDHEDPKYLEKALGKASDLKPMFLKIYSD